MLQHAATIVLSSILINDERYNKQLRNTCSDEIAFLCSNANTSSTTNISVSLQISLCIYTSESLTIFKIHFYANGNLNFEIKPVCPRPVIQHVRRKTLM